MKLNALHLALLAALPMLGAPQAGAAGRADAVSLSLPGLSGAGAITQVTAINDQGQVIGYASGTYNGVGNSYSFLYANGGYSVLNLGIAGASRPLDINSAGQIVGNISSSTTLTGFLYANGTTTVLASGNNSGNAGAYAINDRGEVAGNTGSGAFIQTSAGLAVVPGSDGSYQPTGMNLSAQVVGTQTTMPNSFGDGTAKPDHPATA